MGNAQVRPNLTVRSVRQFKIEGFSMATGDDCVRTPRWSVGGHGWEVRCYPASSVCNMWVSFKLALLAKPSCTGADVVSASLACRLIDPAGLATEPAEERTVSATFVRGRGGESAPLVLAHRRDLEVSGYLGGDGSITVECVVTVLRVPAADMHGTSSQVAAATMPMPVSNLHRHLGELLRSGAGADVTFVVSGQRFAPHTAVLAARSPAFMAEFFADTLDQTCPRPRRVEVEDIEAAAFKAMLHFIYTDTAPELDPKGEAATAMAMAMAGRLIAAADRYGLDRLKVICSRKLSGGVSVETAATTLVLAERYKCPRLKARCVEFIVGTPAILEAVLATEGYKQLERTCPSLLVDLLKSARGRKN